MVWRVNNSFLAFTAITRFLIDMFTFPSINSCFVTLFHSPGALLKAHSPHNNVPSGRPFLLFSYKPLSNVCYMCVIQFLFPHERDVYYLGLHDSSLKILSPFFGIFWKCNSVGREVGSLNQLFLS